MPKRTGDTVNVPGDYQARAITSGPSIQRFWHQAKLLSIKNLLPPVSGDYVLDVGCGSGVVSSFLGASGARVVGIDINPEAIAFAMEHYSLKNVSFSIAAVDAELPVEGGVDKIYCLEVIEHIYMEQTGAMLDEFWRKLRPGGKIFLTTPNYRSVWPLIEWAMDRSGLFPVMAGHQHVEHYNRRKLRAVCERHGFRITDMRTMCLLSPWLSPISRRLAAAALSVELHIPFLPGAILIAVLEKP